MPIIYSGQNRKNAILNGCFRLWTQDILIEHGCGADKNWMNYKSINYFRTVSKGTFTSEYYPPLNPKYYSRTEIHQAGTIASDLCVKYTWINNARTFAGEVVTLSFLARSTPAMPIATEITRNYGTGGTPSPMDFGMVVNTHNLTTSLALHSVTFRVPSLSGKTIGTDPNTSYLEILFWFGAGSDFNSRCNSLGQQSGIFDLAYVQLELGPVATSFDLRPEAEEERLIQWCEEQIKGVHGGYGGGWLWESIDIQYRMPKRATPTLFLVNVDEGWNSIFAGVNNPSEQGAEFVLLNWGAGLFFYTAFISAYCGYVGSSAYNPYGSCRVLFPDYSNLFLNIQNTSISFQYGNMHPGVNTYEFAGESNGGNSRGLIGGGHNNSNALYAMRYITLNIPEVSAVGCGNLYYPVAWSACVSNKTYNSIVFGGGVNSNYWLYGTEYTGWQHKIANTGADATYYGALTEGRSGLSGMSNGMNNRGVFVGGRYQATYHYVSDRIDYVTINTSGNATDWGNLNQAVAFLGAMSNNENNIGIICGGADLSGTSIGTIYNNLQYMNISTASGNATDWGDINVTLYQHACASNGSFNKGICAGGLKTNTVTQNYGIKSFFINTGVGTSYDYGNLTAHKKRVALSHA